MSKEAIEQIQFAMSRDIRLVGPHMRSMETGDLIWN